MAQKIGSERYLVISDLQIPFEAEHALDFCIYVKRHYKIPDENVYCAGDEVDNLHGSSYPKDPDGHHTPNSEIKEAREKIREWAASFPFVRLAISNHGLRWLKKAAAVEIPSQLIRAYQEVLQFPDTWVFRHSWRVKGTMKEFIVKHGLDCGGKTPYRQQAEIAATSVAFGHLHSSAGLCHVRTLDKNVWAMNVGCLIDVDAYAFKYEQDHKFKPNLGCGIILDGGRTPSFIPYE